MWRGSGGGRGEGGAVSADLFVLRAKTFACARRILLDDVRPEVEELLQREQVLVRLLPPLAEADEHKVLLQVPLLFRQRMQAGVFDRPRCLQGKALGPLHLFWREPAPAITLRPDH